MTTVSAVSAEGAGTILSSADVDGFQAVLRGDLLGSTHESYEAARRVWNGNIDRRPTLIGRCAGVADVQQAVNFARTHMHGAPTRVATTATAFAARRAQWTSMPSDSGQTAQIHRATSRGCERCGAEWSRISRAVRTSTISPRTIARKRSGASFGESYERLRRLKTVYDPTNLFRDNANIPPA